MSLIEQIAVSLASSGIIAVATVFVVKKLFDRSVDHLFQQREAEFKVNVDAKKEATSAMFSKELMVYPEVMEVVYRSRNAARDFIIEKKNDPKIITEFNAVSIHLTDNLYKYKVFFPKDIFDKLHAYKRLALDIVVLINEKTKPLSERTQEKLVDDLVERQLGERYEKLDKLYNELSEEITNYLNSRTLTHKK
jgi:hypothetical protein